jgi:2-keto-myo-inositol isomerase
MEIVGDNATNDRSRSTDADLTRHLSRRSVLLAPLTQVLAQGAGATGKMTLCMYQDTLGTDYRRSLEGISRAGIKYVELGWRSLEEFLKTENLATARRVVTDLGLKPVSCGAGLEEFWNPNRIEIWKRRCEQFSSFGIDRIYCTSRTTRKITLDDYKVSVDFMREAGDIAKQYRMTTMLEFIRASPLISTLTTLLKITREAAHPNVRPLLDCYHFWSGISKFEDLDLIRTGEIAHVHFQDMPDMPRELLDDSTRLIPGDGISPLVRILRKLSEAGYSGPLSVELFLPEFTKGDPYEVSVRIRQKAEAVMRQARVI